MESFDDLVPPEIAGPIIQGHVEMYLTDPERAHYFDTTSIGGPGIVPTILISSRGRKSGELRHAPVLYMDYKSAYLVVASKGGLPENPAWYWNLRDNPECEIRVGPLRTTARARELDGPEREQAWKEVSDLWPIYTRYQNRTERRIPLVVLEPIER